jgi:predicted Zn-dependent protease
MAFELTGAKSAREAAQALANKEGVRVQQAKAVDLNGRNAYQIVGQANTQQGVAGLVSTFLEHNGRVYSFMGLTSQSAPQTGNDPFSQVIRGFSELRDSRVLNVQPARVQVVTTDRSGPFASFLPTSDAPGLTAEDLAILNQVQLNQTIPAGTKIKIPTTSSVGSRQMRQTGPRE